MKKMRKCFENFLQFVEETTNDPIVRMAVIAAALALASILVPLTLKGLSL